MAPPFRSPLRRGPNRGRLKKGGGNLVLAATDRCHLSAEPAVERAWAAFRAGRLDEALRTSSARRRRCRQYGADILLIFGASPTSRLGSGQTSGANDST